MSLYPVQVISFQARCGAKIAGKIMIDYGHALAIEVTKTNRKQFRDRVITWPKNDMGGAQIEEVR